MTTALDVATYVQASQSLSQWEAHKLQKLVYFVQAWHLAWTGTPIFDDKFEAWPNGPVNRGIYRDNKYGGISGEVPLFEPETQGIIDAVLDHYGKFDWDTLVALTHEDAPWIEARKGLKPDQPSTRELNAKTMLDFYTAKALVASDAPSRKVFVSNAASDSAKTTSARVAERWREGLLLLANK